MSCSLHACGYDDAELFSFQGLRSPCKVVDVYDGDTVTIVLKDALTPNTLTKLKIRLLGIDTPELRDPDTKAAGLAARNWLLAQLIHLSHEDIQAYEHLDKKGVRALLKAYQGLHFVELHGFDKYGRVLGRVWADADDVRADNDLNAQLIARDLAKPFMV